MRLSKLGEAPRDLDAWLYVVADRLVTEHLRNAATRRELLGLPSTTRPTGAPDRAGGRLGTLPTRTPNSGAVRLPQGNPGHGVQGRRARQWAARTRKASTRRAAPPKSPDPEGDFVESCITGLQPAFGMPEPSGKKKMRRRLQKMVNPDDLARLLGEKEGFHHEPTSIYNANDWIRSYAAECLGAHPPA